MEPILSRVAAFLKLIYAPAMWACVAVLVLLGASGLLVPNTLRGTLRMFTRKGPVRILGVLLMILGAGMFSRASGTAEPVLVKVLGVFLFIDGGVGLFVPTLGIILAEWAVSIGNRWYRLLSLLDFGLAYLFYVATKLKPIV